LAHAMKVLVISNMYPTKRFHYVDFIKHQIDALIKRHIDIVKVVRYIDVRITYIPFYINSILSCLFRSYDLIHAHYGFHSAFFPALLGNRPLIVTFHRGDALNEPYRNRLYNWLQKYVVARADHIIAVSSEIKQALIDNLGAQAKNVTVITCGVDSQAFKPSDKLTCRQKLGIASGQKVVLFIGQLIERKGVELIYECAKRLPDASFVFIGNGPLKAEQSNCRFLGEQPNHTLPAWLSAADAFIVPSTSEGTPVVVLEALSCGAPVIATNVGGNPDVIKDGETGFLIKPNDLDMLVGRITHVLENPDAAHEMGKRGREAIVRHYDHASIAEQINCVYERTLSAK
jgi:glycosyltransferase involved in cell wall biosynthesis